MEKNKPDILTHVIIQKRLLRIRHALRIGFRHGKQAYKKKLKKPQHVHFCGGPEIVRLET